MESRLKLATWNINSVEYERLQNFIAKSNEKNVGLITLQEVSRANMTSLMLDKIILSDYEVIGTRGEHYFQQGQEKNYITMVKKNGPILTKKPQFHKPEKFGEGHLHYRPPLESKIKLGGNEEAILYCWHNEAGNPSEAQLKTLHNLVANEYAPIIIAGDLNVKMDTASDIFKGKSWSMLSDPYHPGDSPPGGLDHIITNRKIIDATIDWDLSKFNSDSHFPVIGSISWGVFVS